jgi:hypothetical protein
MLLKVKFFRAKKKKIIRGQNYVSHRLRRLTQKIRFQKFVIIGKIFEEKI